MWIWEVMNMPVDKRKKDELFLPQNRVDAAMARIETSTILLENRRYSASIYFSGVAVESVLRAFIERDTKKFDDKHNLKKMSSHPSIVPFFLGCEKMDEKFDTVINYWDNKYRYTDDKKLLTFYYSKQLINKHSEKQKKGLLRNFALQCNDAANAIVTKGFDLFYGGRR